MNRTAEEIKKGLAELSAFLRERLGWTKRSNVLSDALDYIQWLEEREWELFDLLSSAWFTKACYFKQKDGTVYSRVSGEYMTFDQAIDEFARELTYDSQDTLTIDAESVVRCKDCKHYNGHRWCLYFADSVHDDDYCSYGAKMDLEVKE